MILSPPLTSMTSPGKMVGTSTLMRFLTSCDRPTQTQTGHQHLLFSYLHDGLYRACSIVYMVYDIWYGSP
jgi:hypothetical protein